MIRFQSSLPSLLLLLQYYYYYYYYFAVAAAATTATTIPPSPLPSPPSPPPSSWSSSSSSSSPPPLLLPKTGWKQIYFVRALDLSLVRTHSLEEGALAINTIKNISSSASSERTNERAPLWRAAFVRLFLLFSKLVLAGSVCRFSHFNLVFAGLSLQRYSYIYVPLSLRFCLKSQLRRGRTVGVRVSCRLASGRAISTAQVKPAHFKVT